MCKMIEIYLGPNTFEVKSFGQHCNLQSNCAYENEQLFTCKVCLRIRKRYSNYFMLLWSFCETIQKLQNIKSSFDYPSSAIRSNNEQNM